VRLEDGGATLILDGEKSTDSGPGEYPDIYRVFADLIDERRSLVDVAPFRLVADSLLLARTRMVDPVEM
jgi:D-galactose 1-dehydrogenase